ncbi:MAG: DUF2239 domain-containing protein [Phenylobacterium zucineum]|nr:MAG: DUF2239 domain-containing protein [Phenylobacterium zucineum]
MTDVSTFTAFLGDQQVGSGVLPHVATALAGRDLGGAPVFIFDDATGRPVELDLRHGPAAAVAEYERRTAPPPPQRPGRGRPRLGVVAREVTLLPRHWDWLAAQPGGASATLRRLVDEARRDNIDVDQVRETRDAAYRVMSALAGDLPGFEDASRALFAGSYAGLAQVALGWPADVAAYVLRMAAPLSEAPVQG